MLAAKQPKGRSPAGDGKGPDSRWLACTDQGTEAKVLAFGKNPYSQARYPLHQLRRT